MEEPVVQVLEGGGDLTPLLEVMERASETLVQLEANTNYIFLAVILLSGVVVGCAVGWLLHDLWRS